MARQRSLFNDPAAEINELTYVIKSDLSTLHNELEVLHKWVVSHRSGGGGGESLSQHAARNSSAIVDNLKSQLMHTTKNFQEVLQVRTNNLKEQNQRRKQFEAGAASGGGGMGSASDGPASSPAASSASALGNSSIRKRGANPFDALMSRAASAAAHSGAGNGVGGGLEETEATTGDVALSLDGEQGLSTQLLAPSQQSDEYHASRAQAVESIESTIVELGEMYKRLVHIVGMQEEITLRIDANMDQALDNVDKGHHHLLTYYESISGNRWLILKIFAVLIAFLVFFMIFVA